MGRLAIAGLMGRKGFLGPRGGELVKAKSSYFGRQSSPCTLRLRRLWPGSSALAGANLSRRSHPPSADSLRLAPFLFHSLRHGFRQVWLKGLMPSANTFCTGL
uniref:OSJNBb0012A12.5 protein n=1 Tax=Oryza sativa subsp. japonica TaxID=39947 RepID=Q7X8E3_ORYSJ|nr:OSJNBb0012A12.5 [Oryza sativa Japonica Group]CAD40140.2 OSJNBb0069N01.25 [Oryza sativa Japonica Group]